MFNNILVTRLHRLMKSDITTPIRCRAKWFYVDVFDKCTCINTCKYNNYSNADYIKQANNNYHNQIIQLKTNK